MIDNYIYKISKKIYKKLAFSYFRFEILLRSVDDIINNNEFYPNMPKKEIKKANTIHIQLQKICIHLNIALDEYNKMLLNISKSISK